MNRTIDEVTVDGLTFTVKELTVNEVVNFINSDVSYSVNDYVAALILQPIGVTGLMMITDLEEEVIYQLTPSTLEKIKVVCEAKNKAFFGQILPSMIKQTAQTLSE